jgi:hypothetical protein
VFPNINIFGYTLLPGTEYFERRDEYRVETIPIAGYGKAKGEYVVACHTYDRDEGIEGYFLITAHILLIRGYILPLTTRMLALDGTVPVSPLLRAVLRALVARFADLLPGLDPNDRMANYERRAEMYLRTLERMPEAYVVCAEAVDAWLVQHGASAALRDRTQKVLCIDEAFCPRVGPAHALSRRFDFAADRVEHHLLRMELPPEDAYGRAPTTLHIHHPACVGEVLKNPDGGSWMRGQMQKVQREPALTEAVLSP